MDIQLSSMLPRDDRVGGDKRLTARDSRRQRRHPSRNGSGTHARAVRATLLWAALAVLFAVLSATALFYASVQAIGAYSLAQHYQAVQGRVTQIQCATRLQID